MMNPKIIKTIAVLVIAFFIAFCMNAQENKKEEEIDVADISLEELLNVKVTTASKRAESVSDAAGIISVITKDELKRFGGSKLADILNRIPGLFHIGSYFTDRSMMAFRGDSVRNVVTNRHVLVLFDGRPVREVQEGGIKSEIYEAFPIDAIDHIEVIKGPGSVLYGSEAFSGVINIITESAEETGLLAEVAIGEAGAAQYSGKATLKSGDFSLLASGRYQKKDDWVVKYGWGEDGAVAAPTVVFDDISMIDKTSSVFFKGKYKDISFTASYLEIEPAYMIGDYFMCHGLLDSQKLFLDGTWDTKISASWDMSASLTYNQSWFEVLTPSIPFVKRNSHEVLGEITNFISLAENFNLTIGGLFSQAKGIESSTIDGSIHVNGKRNSLAGYAQIDYQFSKTAKGIGGFQLLKVGDAKTTFVPRLGLVWYPHQKINVKILYGYAFRAPYINEIFIDHPTIIGNPELTPELVRSFEVGISYITKNMEASLSYFNNNQTDSIGFHYLPDKISLLQYFNSDEDLHIQGLEFEGKFYINNEFFISGSLLTQKMSDDQLTGLPNFSAKLGLSYSTDLATISLFNIYQGKISKQLYNVNSSNPKPESYNLLYLHARFNLNKIFRMNTKPKFEIFVQGDNLLNDEIWISATGDPNPAQIPWKRGRYLYGGFIITF